MTTKNAAMIARAEYDEATAWIRKTLFHGSPAFADAMSRACVEYEVKMKSAAASGDQAAQKTLKNSEGKYLRNVK